MEELLGEETWFDWRVQGALLIGMFILTGLTLGRMRATAGKYWFIGINALLLTVFSVWFSGMYPFLLSVQAELMNNLHQHEKRLRQNQGIEKTMGSVRLWLVDVSHDISLVDDSAMAPTWGSKQVITDRRKLGWLLTALGNDSLKSYVDLVVCDLTFGSVAGRVDDQSLGEALRLLNQQRKLLIAKSTLSENQEVNGNTAINTDLLAGGGVDLATYFGGNVYAYPLFGRVDSAHRCPSLGYQMYRQLTKTDGFDHGWPQYTETDSMGHGSLITHEFIPEYFVDGDDISISNEGQADTTLEKTGGRLRSYYFQLGQLAAHGIRPDYTLTPEYDPASLAPLTEQLRYHHDKHRRNMVFIGVFDGKERDMHQTAVGPMHGSMILINALLNMLGGAHRISFFYLLFMLAGFGLISYWMVHPARKIELQLFPHHLDGFLGRRGCSLNHYAAQRINWILAERAYLMAPVLLVVAMVFFNHLINIAVVELYLITMGLVLKQIDYFRKMGKRQVDATDPPNRPAPG